MSGATMKYMTSLILLALTGCAGINNGTYMGKNKLDVAPKYDNEVLHPEWGRVPTKYDQMVYREISENSGAENLAQSSGRLMVNNSMQVANVDTSQRTPGTSRSASAMPAYSPAGNENSAQDIERFLARNNMRYEVLPGEHKVIRLLDAIYFQSDSLNMTDQSRDWLDIIARELVKYDGVELVVEGYTDNVGNADYNQQLSVKRAEAVKSWISGRYRTLDKIYARGFGGAMPACQNNSNQGRSCNRRVELMFILPA